jgi:hypothetical protein
MASHGAANKNDRYGWSFVNHEDKMVIFGAWDVNTEPDKALILSMKWARNEQGRKSNAFGESMEYIKLVESEGYSLHTFPIILDDTYDNNLGTGRVRIKDHVEVLSKMTLNIINGDYYAMGDHNPEHSRKLLPNVAQDIVDIFGSIIETTERESLVMARVGQGKFRQNVIDYWGNGERCALTLTDVREILIASHIVPWSKCSTNEERLDGANGILLCAHIDKLFDSHLLTFTKKGSGFISKLSSKIEPSLVKGLGIQSGDELCTDELSLTDRERFEKYMEVHNSQFETKNTK